MHDQDGTDGAEGSTILFVSHNMSLVLQQCERGMVLVNGGVACMDSSENAVAAYLRLNGEAQEVTRVAGQVPWLTIDRFEASNSSVAISFNDPLSFRLVLSLEKDLNNGSLTLFISNSVGARLLTSQVDLGRLASGQHAIQLTLSEHRLLPGAYFVSVVIRQGMETLLRKVQIATSTCWSTTSRPENCSAPW